MTAEFARTTSSSGRRIDTRIVGCILHNISGPVGRTLPPMDLRGRVARQETLPPMPGMAARILELASDPHAGAEDLANTVALDPALAAQVMRWACSPRYGYLGKIDSLHEAIARVLGFDVVMALALGLTALSPLRIPNEGPLGRRALWRHAVYSAELVLALAHALPGERRPDRPGLAYLSGLLHDLGLLLLGHLFPIEFGYLNRLVKANPEVPVTELERYAFGLEHTWLGLWLLQSWHLPEEIQVAAAQHDNPDYRGEHAVYAHLTLVANRLLPREDRGDAERPKLPSAVMRALGLTKAQAMTRLEGLNKAGHDLDALIDKLI